VSQQSDRRGEEAILLLILGVLVCLAFFNSPGTADRIEFLNYMDVGRQKGILAAYPNVGPVDYPPLIFVLLASLSHVADFFHISDFAALKISLMVLTLACAALATGLRQGWRPDLAVAMFLTIVVSAMLEAYIDEYYAIFLLLALYSFQRGYLTTGAALFALSSLVKWQPIILTPLILLYVIPRRPAAADFLRIVPAAAISMIVLLAYADPMLAAFARGFANARLSGQGLNFNWLITGFIELQHPLRDGVVSTLSHVGVLYVSRFQEDPPVPATWIPETLLGLSSVLRYFCYFVSLYYFYVSDRSLLNLVRTSTICFMCYFTFGYGVHESHAFVPAVLGICWLALDRSRFFEAAALAIIFNMNILIFYGMDGAGLRFSPIVGWDVTLYFAAFNVILFFVLWLPVANAVRLSIVGMGLQRRAKLMSHDH
jgi:hypothetical protein